MFYNQLPTYHCLICSKTQQTSYTQENHSPSETIQVLIGPGPAETPRYCSTTATPTTPPTHILAHAAFGRAAGCWRWSIDTHGSTHWSHRLVSGCKLVHQFENVSRNQGPSNLPALIRCSNTVQFSASSLVNDGLGRCPA